MTAQEATTAVVPVRTAFGVLAALRPRQWIKNLLVVGAPLAAGRVFEPAVLRGALVAFVALCLASSCGYLVNDVHDADEDRLHPRKRFRVIASGALGRGPALAMAVLVAAGALGVATLAGGPFVVLVGGYLTLTLTYTLWLRAEPVLELVVVAAGFVLRGASGGVAGGLPISSWFLFVAGFGSLFLVAGKRYAEQIAPRLEGGGGRVTLNTYSPGYLKFVWTCAATLTLVTYALWADQVYRVREDGSWALWSLIPFLLGILRYALDVERGTAEAPENVVLRDRMLHVVGLVWVLLLTIGAGSLDVGF